MEHNMPEPGWAKRRWPQGVDTRDPEGFATFALGLGYDFEVVVNSTARRCSVDPITARRICTHVANQQQGSQS